MSRTDAHVPLRIRIARGDIGYTEVHDHTDGVCDLPDPFDPDWTWRVDGCRREFVWTGIGVCSCWMCHGGEDRRRERRRDRQRTRRGLCAERREWNG